MILYLLFGKSCGFLFCPIIIGFSGCLPDAFTQKATDNFFLIIIFDNLVSLRIKMNAAII